MEWIGVGRRVGQRDGMCEGVADGHNHGSSSAGRQRRLHCAIGRSSAVVLYVVSVQVLIAFVLLVVVSLNYKLYRGVTLSYLN